MRNSTSTSTICEFSSNYSCWIEHANEFNRRAATWMLPTTVIMCLFMVVGIFGNALVLVVYSQRREKTTAIIFTMFLASMDLFACVMLHPYIIYKLVHSYDQTWTVICKLFEFINHCILALSGLTLHLVAIDRYLAICRPFKFLQFHKHVAKGIATVSVISVVGSLPILEFYGATPTVLNEFDSTFVGYKCHYKLEYQNSPVFTAFGAFILGLFMIVIITMIVLYKQVAVTAYLRSRRVRPLSNAHILAGITPLSSSSEGNSFSRSGQSTDKSYLSQGVNSEQSTFPLDELSRNGNRAVDITSIFSVEPKVRKLESIQNPREDNMDRFEIRHNIAENRTMSTRLKAAKVLFSVTAVFFISWMPFFIMRICGSLNPNFWSDRSDTKFILEPLLNHAFYLNNAVNPIIYALINKNFRLDCQTVFKKHFNVRRR